MKTLLLTAGLLACIAAQAQVVYRCGPDGREYSQLPCAAGKAVDVSDVRSASQRAEARAVASSEQARGMELERARVSREALKPAGAVHIGSQPVRRDAALPKARASSKKKHPQQAQDNEFRALSPAKKAKKPG